MHCSTELQIVFGTLFSVFIRQKGNLPVCSAFPLVVSNETLLGFNNLNVEFEVQLCFDSRWGRLCLFVDKIA